LKKEPRATPVGAELRIERTRIKDRNSNGTSRIVSSPSAVVNGGFGVERS
jgi:hypothetical protein